MKTGENLLALFFFILMGLVGMALIAMGSWILLAPAAQSARPADTPVFLTPTLASSEELPIIITATLEPSQTPAPTDIAPAATHTLFVPPTATSTKSSPLTWAACQGAYLSQLHVGDKAMVSLDPPLPNNVRAEPETTAKFLYVIQPGDVVEITGGPGCSNNWVWWQILTQDGRTGWTAEGDGTEYWLVPAK